MNVTSSEQRAWWKVRSLPPSRRFDGGDPIGALNEIHRVLTPGGEASIYDLRKDASLDEIAAEVRHMGLSAFNAFVTRFIFRFGLLKRAYTRDAVEALAALSRFRTCQFEPDGIGFELKLAKRRQARESTPKAHTAA